MVDDAGGHAGGLRLTLAASGALTSAVLPVFLLGALSRSVGDDLGLTEVEIGGAVTVLFVAAGLAATPAGRLVERLGARPALRTGVTVSALGTAAIGAFAASWWHIALLLAVVGAAVAMVDTGAARAFAEGLPPDRQGTGFGVKEASVPAASLLAGLALPALGAEVTWRAAFLAAPVVALLVLAALSGRAGRDGTGPASREPARGTPRQRLATPALVLLAVGAALTVAAATAAATFLVPSAIDRGLSPGAAGAVLSAASVASIVVRVVAGRWADRHTATPTRVLVALMALGAAGGGLLAAPGTPALVGAVLVLGGGWGWTGLAFLTAVRAHPTAPASAAGVVLTGLAAGGAVGPLAFGALADAGSFTLAWTVSAAAMALGALATSLAGRSLSV